MTFYLTLLNHKEMLNMDQSLNIFFILVEPDWLHLVRIHQYQIKSYLLEPVPWRLLMQFNLIFHFYTPVFLGNKNETLARNGSNPDGCNLDVWVSSQNPYITKVAISFPSSGKQFYFKWKPGFLWLEAGFSFSGKLFYLFMEVSFPLREKHLFWV